MLASTGPPLIGGGEGRLGLGGADEHLASTGPPLIGGGEKRATDGFAGWAKASTGPPLIGGGEVRRIEFRYLDLPTLQRVRR